MSGVTQKQKLTGPQFAALKAALDKGGAWFMSGQSMGGSKRRMIYRMIERGWLHDCPPYAITRVGVGLLVAAEASGRFPGGRT